MDTIFALSTGALPCAVAVVRVSGALAGIALDRLCGARPAPREARYAALRGEDESVIDRALVFWFPAPASFSGEDMAEFHVHGSRAVIDALFVALAGVGARPAEAGEFTRRAFANGKVDLAEAEGLADLLVAETEAQRLQALRQMEGGLSDLVETWRSELIALRAEVEAHLDFSDEGDVGEEAAAGVCGRIDDLAARIRRVAGSDVGERVRAGIRVVIAGAPNAGKSSLLNRLARRDVAIATPEPGTTRDVLEVRLDAGGFPLLIFDTAGLRESDSLAERSGVERALAAARGADLVLLAIDPLGDPAAAAVDGLACPVWRIGTKADLARASDCDLWVSSHSEEGLPQLERRLAEFARTHYGGAEAGVTRLRHRQALLDAAAGLERARLVEDAERAEMLRQAGDALGRITGAIGMEDVLDRIFAEFCIGK